jgi:ribosome-binding factor A
MTRRARQIAAELHRTIQAVIDRGLQDPRLSGVMLTITDVRVGSDLRNATVMVSAMPAGREELALHGLKAASAHIRRQAANLMEVRQLPDLAFRLDKSLKKQADVLAAIARATAQREAAGQMRPEPAGGWESGRREGGESEGGRDPAIS